MQYTTLGKTGLRVSVVGLGTGGFSRMGLKTGKSEAESARLVLDAVELGINFIDTAPPYGTEGVVGLALKSIPRHQVVVATKSTVYRNDEWWSPERVVASLDSYVASGDGHRLRRCGQPACSSSCRWTITSSTSARRRLSNRSARARSGNIGPHREPDRRLYQRSTAARPSRSDLGSRDGGFPYAAPKRAQKRISGDAPERRRHALDVRGAQHLCRSSRAWRGR